MTDSDRARSGVKANQAGGNEIPSVGNLRTFFSKDASLFDGAGRTTYFRHCMNESDLPPSEARAVIRRHVHDLRNMIYSMDLEIACLLEDPAARSCVATLQKIRHQLAVTERGLGSLSVRFVEPALGIAAAADLFHNWRQQINKLRQGSPVTWEEPDCGAAITVDFSAVVAVLCEICLEAKSGADTAPLMTGLTEDPREVVFFVREPASEESHRDTPPEVQQWAEWERMITISGGQLERTHDSLRAHSVTRLRFPVTA